MMSHPPSLFTLTAASGSERPESTLHLKDVAVFPWLSAASLDHYKGTQLADVNKADGAEVVGVIGVESVDEGWPGGQT
jgi:hypothetical protein